ncbi:hypothetical protein [Streptomyces chryseus]|uniref:HNH endonuclease n=1 Tax=Streptomyces chryseus TaxID=68186 RepID=A0ABQ3DFV6_9ACTN|nr:hypothetical protein [Streptomyces chryseus]GHA83206.1 hypothetical protein GCM10010346_01920 [Streptomyces chryseus]
MTSPVRNGHPWFRKVTRRDGRLCNTVDCWEQAAVLAPKDVTLRLVEAVHLDASGLVAVCPDCARVRANAGTHARTTANAAALAAAQLSLFST